MNRSDVNEFSIKEKRILDYMEKNGYDAAIISRQDNFSWLTCGGHNRVVITSEGGVCMVVIMKQEKFLVANSMDAQRIMDEDMPVEDYNLVSLKWYETSVVDKVLEIISGKKVISDTSIPGADCKLGEFYSMQYPLTEYEIERYRWLSRKAEEIIRKVADEIKPGMTEKEVEAMLLSEYAKYDIVETVGIIGSDERISKYRHCVASNKKIEKMVMLAPAVRKWGLTVPISRMIYFGETLPEETAKRFDAVCVIESNTLANCVPGKRFTDIFEIQKKCFEETGYTEEWRHHFQGGITGYVINDPTKCVDPKAVVQDCQTFNWYITITGVKAEETTLTSAKGVEILSSTGLWPVKKYEADGKVFELPQILMR